MDDPTVPAEQFVHVHTPHQLQKKIMDETVHSNVIINTNSNRNGVFYSTLATIISRRSFTIATYLAKIIKYKQKSKGCGDKINGSLTVAVNCMCLKLLSHSYCTVYTLP